MLSDLKSKIGRIGVVGDHCSALHWWAANSCYSKVWSSCRWRLHRINLLILNQLLLKCASPVSQLLIVNQLLQSSGTITSVQH